jgi:hypothetical protein
MSGLQVPCDSSWTVSDSIEIGEKGDTVWTFRAEKHFASVEEVNSLYSSDTGVNALQERSASFKKRFRWFHTFYSFSESIGKTLLYGYPSGEFMNKEVSDFNLLPDPVRDTLLNGPDSLRYRAISDSLDKATDRWIMKSLASEWIEEFAKLIPESDTLLTRENMKQKEDYAARLLLRDSSGYNDAVRWMLGDLAVKYSVEEDSAAKIIEKRFTGQLDFKSYSVKFKMPGELVSTNGIIVESGELLWQPRSEYFVSEPFIMTAESKETNTWAYVVTAAFLIFVASGLAFRRLKK